jgi:hypothetical protein
VQSSDTTITSPTRETALNSPTTETAISVAATSRNNAMTSSPPQDLALCLVGQLYQYFLSRLAGVSHIGVNHIKLPRCCYRMHKN